MLLSTVVSKIQFICAGKLVISGTAEPGGPPLLRRMTFFFVFVLVYGTYKEIKKEKKKTKVLSSGYSLKEGWNT